MQQAISVFCDSLKFVLIYFQEVNESDAFVAKFVLKNLCQLKYIYILYFFADILHSLAIISNVFQLKYVDVTTMGSIVRIEIAQICMMLIVKFCDLNVDVLNESTSYHILHDYGPHGGYFKRLQYEVRGSIFHNFQMTQSRVCIDLKTH